MDLFRRRKRSPGFEDRRLIVDRRWCSDRRIDDLPVETERRFAVDRRGGRDRRGGD